MVSLGLRGGRVHNRKVQRPGAPRRILGQEEKDKVNLSDKRKKKL